jgi:peptidyl-prolyl cis-trans isomerase SDCCAG10
MLQAFQNKLMATPVSHQTADKKKQDQPDGEPCKLHQVINCESCARDEVQEVREKEFEGDTWDESGWLSHELVFAKDTKGKDLMKRRDDIDDYVVIDPRVRQLAEKRRK